MWWQRPAGVVLAALAVTVPAHSATTSPKNPSTSVAVTFDDSAAQLPQAQIRAAIARELGMPEDSTVLAAPRELSISVEASELIVRFNAPSGRAERRVAMPNDTAQIPELVQLIAGNLARDQRVLIEPAAATAAANPPAPPPHDAVVTAKPKFRRHWLGLHVAQDFLYSPWSAVCDGGPAADTTYSCYHAGSNQPYIPNANSTFRMVQSVMILATTRILASYDYALTPYFTLGARAGFALLGGPSANAPTPYGGLSDKPFLPLHLEARAAWWFAPLTNERVRAFVGVGSGLMQMDAKANVGGVCPDGGFETSDGCGPPLTYPPTPGPPPVEVEAWKRVGRGFVDVRLGMEVRLWDELGVELDVHGIALFPAVGYALEPSLGVVYGL